MHSSIWKWLHEFMNWLYWSFPWKVLFSWQTKTNSAEKNPWYNLPTLQLLGNFEITSMRDQQKFRDANSDTVNSIQETPIWFYIQKSYILLTVIYDMHVS